MSGKLIIIEGVDGSGKGTVISNIMARLREDGVPVFSHVEPGGGPIGKHVRPLIISGRYSSMAVYHMLMAARYSLYEHIKNELDKGFTIILDRSFVSTFVYQGYLGGVEIDRIINDTFELIKSTVKIKPDIVFLDINRETMFARMKKKNDVNVLDIMHSTEIDKIIEYYHVALNDISALELGRVLVVDANGTEEEVKRAAYEQIRSIIAE